jgi:hypothetical protein
MASPPLLARRSERSVAPCRRPLSEAPMSKPPGHVNTSEKRQRGGVRHARPCPTPGRPCPSVRRPFPSTNKAIPSRQQGRVVGEKRRNPKHYGHLRSPHAPRAPTDMVSQAPDMPLARPDMPLARPQLASVPGLSPRPIPAATSPPPSQAAHSAARLSGASLRAMLSRACRHRPLPCGGAAPRACRPARAQAATCPRSRPRP